MSFWNRTKPSKAAVQIDQKTPAYTSPTTYIVDTVNEIEELVQHMEEKPNYFLNKYKFENPHYNRHRMNFKVRRTQGKETISDQETDIPIVAIANYRYKGEPYSFSFPWYAFGGLISVSILCVICYILAMSTQKAERILEQQPACILYLQDGQPKAVYILGDLLYYDGTGHVDPIWEGTALWDQLNMAFKPVESGCEIVHIDKESEIK